MKLDQRCAVRVIALIFMLTIDSFQAAQSIEPRAWLVSNGKMQAVLVAESHFGNRVENDAYFDDVVQPSYAVANAALMESTIESGRFYEDFRESNMPCLLNPKDRLTDHLGSAFEELISITRNNHLQVPIWMESWQTVPEYLFTSILLDDFMVRALGSGYQPAVITQLGLGVSYRLRESTHGPSKRYLFALEDQKARREIFCHASASDRQDNLIAKIKRISALLRLKHSDPSFSTLHTLAIPLGESVQKMIECVDKPTPCRFDSLVIENQQLLDVGWMALNAGMYEIAIKQRTHAWVPLIAQALDQYRRTVIVVGAMHLPDLNVGGKVEPGLVSLLRNSGFSVTAITSAEDIKSTYLAPKFSDRLRSWLKWVQ
jgi:hypothetical protein